MTDERKITNVYHWANGMTMVFDQFGEQMPEYQGPTAEMRQKLEAAGWRGSAEEQSWPTDRQIYDATR